MAPTSARVVPDYGSVVVDGRRRLPEADARPTTNAVPRRWRRAATAAIVVAAVCASMPLVRTAAWGHDRDAPTQLATGKSSADAPPPVDLQPEPLTIAVSSWYTATHGPIARAYPWLAPGEVVVDVKQDAVVDVTGCGASAVHVALEHIATGDRQTLMVSPDWRGVARVVVVLDALGAYTVSAIEAVATGGGDASTAADDGGTTTPKKARAAAPRVVHALRVRHEIRDLRPEDRERLLDAMRVMWTLDGSAGRAKYGADYVSAAEFQIWHHINAAQRDADHFHQGVGFFVQHARITLQFEAALRAVDPNVAACPYWDFTIDETRAQRGRQAHVFDSELFSPQFWGSVHPADLSAPARTLGALADLDAFRIPDGRFANATATLAPPFDVTQSGLRVDVQNAYGQVRAPWNNNPSKYVTRFVDRAVTAPGGGVFPGCQAHLNATTVDYPLAPWMWYVQNGPHANVHAHVGGTIVVAAATDEAAALFSRLIGADVTPELMATLVKAHTMYRLGIIDYPETCPGGVADDDAAAAGRRRRPTGEATTTTTTTSAAPSFAEYARTCLPRCNTALWAYVDIGREMILSRDVNNRDAVFRGDPDVKTLYDTSFSHDWRTYRVLMRGALDKMRADADAASRDDLDALGRAYCARVPTTIEGDQKDSSGSLDPLFWTIHPTMERLYLRRLLTGVGFTDWSWPNQDACAASRADVSVDGLDGYHFGATSASTATHLVWGTSDDLCVGHFSHSVMYCNSPKDKKVAFERNEAIVDDADDARRGSLTTANASAATVAATVHCDDKDRAFFKKDSRMGRTNAQVLRLMNPNRSPADLGFEYPVYHHFQMDHCDGDVAFPDLAAADTTTTTATAADPPADEWGAGGA